MKREEKGKRIENAPKVPMQFKTLTVIFCFRLEFAFGFYVHVELRKMIGSRKGGDAVAVVVRIGVLRLFFSESTCSPLWAAELRKVEVECIFT